MDYSQAIHVLLRRATCCPDVRALVLTGSAAAGTEHPLSDRDIQVFVTGIPALLADETWWSALGEVLVVERLTDDDGNPTRLVHYAGSKIDFTLVPARTLHGRVYERPFEVLLDKDGAAATASLDANRAVMPSTDEFGESVNQAWAAALMEAKAIVRDEPWSAKLRDQDLKGELLRMIEWDHRARYGAEFDVEYLGKGMRRWMDTEVQQALEQCWAGIHPRDSERALLATVELYRVFAVRTARQLGVSVFDHERALRELRSILTVAD